MLQRLEFRTMGCQMLAVVDGAHQPSILPRVPEWFEEWEQVLSRFRYNSELTRLNQAHDRPVPVSPILWNVFQAARRAEQMTNGLVTPTLLDAILEAGYDRPFDVLPHLAMPGLFPVISTPASLDAITQSRFAQALAEQQKSTAKTQADAKLAEEQGKIRVSQGTIQEQARQDAITAELQAQALAAQQQVIQQQNSNDLLDAKLQLDVNNARYQAAEVKAKADNADKLYVASILQDNPNYAYWLSLQTLAPTWTDVDKVYIPAGTNPLTVMGVGTVPGVTIPATPQ